MESLLGSPVASGFAPLAPLILSWNYQSCWRSLSLHWASQPVWTRVHLQSCWRYPCWSWSSSCASGNFPTQHLFSALRLWSNRCIWAWPELFWFKSSPKASRTWHQSSWGPWSFSFSSSWTIHIHSQSVSRSWSCTCPFAALCFGHSLSTRIRSPLFGRSCVHCGRRCSRRKSASCRCYRNASLALLGELDRSLTSSGARVVSEHSQAQWSSSVVSSAWMAWRLHPDR